jgi:hypothetical protein
MGTKIVGPSGRGRFGYSRPNAGNMSEFERIIHLIVSLQILFGSRRGLIPILILVLCLGAWGAYRLYPSWILAKADRLWSSKVTGNQIDAVLQYKQILRKRDWLDSQSFQLSSRTDRTRLYQTIIEYEMIQEDEKEARTWIGEAWKEGIREFNFHDQEVKTFFVTVANELKGKNSSRANRILNSDED